MNQSYFMNMNERLKYPWKPAYLKIIFIVYILNMWSNEEEEENNIIKIFL